MLLYYYCIDDWLELIVEIHTTTYYIITTQSVIILELVRIELGLSPSDIINYEPFGICRFATGTHSQRPLSGLCLFVLGGQHLTPSTTPSCFIVFKHTSASLTHRSHGSDHIYLTDNNMFQSMDPPPLISLLNMASQKVPALVLSSSLSTPALFLKSSDPISLRCTAMLMIPRSTSHLHQTLQYLRIPHLSPSSLAYLTSVRGY